MKVCYVTPRYGAEVIGGAEHAARMLAERLAAHTGWQVVARTSCALDAHTWRNAYAPAEIELNGVCVKRFPTLQERDRAFLRTSARVHERPKIAAMTEQEAWIDQQGPLVPGVLDGLVDENADVYVFYPYLYYPTVRGVPLVADRAVLHPAAHNETPLRMSIFQRVFSQANAFVFQTEGERALVEHEFGIGARAQLLLGLGVEPQEGDEQRFRRETGIGDIPYVLCVGRIDAGKGAVLLARYFSEWKARNPGEIKLVFVGPEVTELAAHPDVIVAGKVDDDAKWGALHGCTALISPSPYEAFSLVLLEAWSAAKPVLVNRSCIATREHVGRSHGGLTFEGYATFEAALNRLVSDTDIACALGAAGKRYVDTNYLWPNLIDRYASFLESVTKNVV